MCGYATTAFVVWTSVLYDTHASPATALHWLYLSRWGNRHSQWARCHSLDGFSSTHTLLILSDDEDIRRGSTKPFPDSTNLLRTQRMERTSQKGFSSRAPDLASLPPWVPLPPYRWVLTTPMGQLMRIFLHCLFAYIYLLWITFPNISNISRFEQRSGPLDPITKTVESYHQDLLRLGRCQA